MTLPSVAASVTYPQAVHRLRTGPPTTIAAAPPESACATRQTEHNFHCRPGAAGRKRQGAQGMPPPRRAGKAARLEPKEATGGASEEEARGKGASRCRTHFPDRPAKFGLRPELAKETSSSSNAWQCFGRGPRKAAMPERVTRSEAHRVARSGKRTDPPSEECFPLVGDHLELRKVAAGSNASRHYRFGAPDHPGPWSFGASHPPLAPQGRASSGPSRHSQQQFDLGVNAPVVALNHHPRSLAISRRVTNQALAYAQRED